MNYCFYNNSYKTFDPTGLTSYLSSFSVRGSLNKAREQMKQFIQQASSDSLIKRFESSDSLIKRFESSIRQQNEKDHTGLSIKEIDEMLLDILFDFFLIPDFLENVLYETLVNVITEHADLHVDKIRKQMYERGRDKGYLFPIRARILEETVVLEDKTELPLGSLVYLNLKQAGVYHSAGPRRCIGQTFAHAFETHFDCLQSLEFKVKSVSEPFVRVTASHNPNTPIHTIRIPPLLLSGCR